MDLKIWQKREVDMNFGNLKNFKCQKCFRAQTPAGNLVSIGYNSNWLLNICIPDLEFHVIPRFFLNWKYA